MDRLGLHSHLWLPAPPLHSELQEDYLVQFCFAIT